MLTPEGALVLMQIVPRIVQFAAFLTNAVPVMLTHFLTQVAAFLPHFANIAAQFGTGDFGLSDAGQGKPCHNQGYQD